MDKSWLFVYEVVPVDKLRDEWKNMKKFDVSFINKELSDRLFL